MPTVAPTSPNARPRSAPRNSCWISAEFCGARQPAASPCTIRAATSRAAVGAAPAAALQTTKPTRPMRNIRRRPRASPSRPAGTSASPKVSAYPDTTHWTADGEAPTSRWIEGSATETMLTSSRLMNPTTRVTDRARQRRGARPSASPAGSGEPGDQRGEVDGPGVGQPLGGGLHRLQHGGGQPVGDPAALQRGADQPGVLGRPGEPEADRKVVLEHQPGLEVGVGRVQRAALDGGQEV